MRRLVRVCCVAMSLGLGYPIFAEDVAVPKAEWEAIKARMADLESRAAPVVSSVDTAMDNKFGPVASVVTKTGKLTVGGLMQVWYYSIQNDHRGFFDDPNVNTIADTNEALDNDSFRIRRAELKFTLEINENIRSYLMLDTAREALGFPGVPSNQADGNGIKKANQVSPQFLAIDKPVGVNSVAFINAALNGASSAAAPRLLQDAWINWHGCIPHHDVQLGQMLVPLGEEGIRPNGELDFVERSMVGFACNTRDLGAVVHGSWWECGSKPGDGRLQYWAGVFNGPGTFFEPGNAQNRPDDNDSKDVVARMLVRPVWDDCWGKLELGGSFMGGKHGESGNREPIATPLNGLNRQSRYAARYNAWASYKFGDCLTGLWVRGEGVRISDREVPGSTLDLLGNGTSANAFVQQQGATFTRQGVYGSLGYKMSESKICSIPCWLKPVEFLGRYDQYQNISMADEVNPRHTDAFYTRASTAGINYYIIGHNAKVQANYNWVDLPADKSDAARVFHNTRNDSFVINFQVMF